MEEREEQWFSRLRDQHTTYQMLQEEQDIPMTNVDDLPIVADLDTPMLALDLDDAVIKEMAQIRAYFDLSADVRIMTYLS